MGHLPRLAAAAALAAALALPSSLARAQGMPDLRTISGRPLPVPDLPEGSVAVRVSRQIPVNGVGGAEVIAIIASPSGEARKRTSKTGADGRALFEGLKPGSLFQAEVTVDGERLQTTKFPIPPSGGTRVMLIAGLGSAPAGGAPGPGQAQGAAGTEGAASTEDEPFTLGAVTGKVVAAPDLPAGTLELTLRANNGQPLGNLAVQLGQVAGADNKVKVLSGTSDAAGVVRFRGLATGETIGYAAVMEHQLMRLGTEAFRMAADKGMRGEIRAIDRTSDPAVLKFENRSKIIFEVAEDALQVMEALVFKNVSEKIFDGGSEPLMVPLASGFEAARDLPGGIPIEVRAGEGVLVRTPIPPNRAAVVALQLRVTFVLLANGGSSVDFRQKFPVGLEGPLFIVPEAAHFTLSAPGLRALPDKKDSAGNVVKLYELDDVPSGGVLSMTIEGLPINAHAGRNVAAVICLLLIAGAVIAARQPVQGDKAQAEAERLADRREKLFADLVALEQTRRQGGGVVAGGGNGVLEERRRELVTKLENIYKDLARGESPIP